MSETSHEGTLLRVLVTGGRDYDDWSALRTALIALNAERKIGLIIQGGGSGADRMAGAWAAQRGIACARVDAHWNTLGRKAGPLRNEWMVRLLTPDLVLAFPGGTGTANCVSIAEAAGIPVRYAVQVSAHPDREGKGGERP